MSKELEALENIKLCFKRIEEVSKDAREVLGMELIDKIDWDNIEEISIIEKGLKALEIIKEKNVEISWLKVSDDLNEYNVDSGNLSKPLTEEEFELIKEMLE